MSERSDHEAEASQPDEEKSSTCFCPYCNIHLAFPTGSTLIQCPKCSNTLDPTASHQIRCSGCKCLLAYPPDSLYIQCPRCLNTMDPRQPPLASGEDDHADDDRHDRSHPSSSSHHRHERSRDRDRSPPPHRSYHAPSSSSHRDRDRSSGGGGDRDHHRSEHASGANFPKAPPRSKAASAAAPVYSKEYNTGPLTAGAEVKKRRDPNAPKAVCNAYMVFCRLERARVKQENPELPFGQIGAKLGEVWRNMSADEKQPYEDRAGVDRERYRREMEQYTHGLKSEKRQRTKMEQSAGSAKKNQPKQQQRQEYDEDQYDDDEGEEY